MRLPSYSAGKPPATPHPSEQLDGRRLAVIVRTLDNPGRMRLACQIVAGRLEIVELTPSQVAILCAVPAAYRQHVRDAAANS